MKQLSTVFIVLLLLAQVVSAQQSAESLLEQTAKLCGQAKYEEALPLARQALQLTEKGETERLTLAYYWLGYIHYQQGEWAEAADFLGRSLKAGEEQYGVDHALVGATAGLLGATYQQLGRYHEALGLSQRALASREREQGADNPALISSLINLAALFQKLRDYDAARPQLERAMELAMASGKPGKLALAGNAYGLLLLDLGQPTEAVDFLKPPADWLRQSKPANPDLLISLLHNLSEAYRALGQFESADSLNLEALELSRGAYGAEHAETLDCLNTRAQLLKDLGDLGAAKDVQEQVLSISRRAMGAQHPRTATYLNNLASLVADLGDLRSAIRLQRESQSIRERVFGKNSPAILTNLNNLARLYSAINDTARARELYQQALAIAKQNLGARHPLTATVLHNLALQSASGGDLQAAARGFEQALEIHRYSYGHQSPRTLAVQLQLARVKIQSGELARALPLLKALLSQSESGAGGQSVASDVLLELGFAYSLQGEFEQARAACQKAARQLRERLGEDHQRTASSHRYLAFIELLAGNPGQALTLEQRSLDGTEAFLSNVLSFTSEEQRLSYHQTLSPFDLLATLADSGSDPKVDRLLARTVVRHKGLILDSLLEDMQLARHSQNPAAGKALQRLRAIREQLSQQLDGQKVEPALKEEAAKLESVLAGLGADMGQPRRALQVTVAQIQKTLPPTTVLVDFVQYQSLSRESAETHYGAIVLSRDGLDWVSLGPAEAIEALVRRYRRGVRRGNGANLAVLQKLHRVLWQPLQSKLPAELDSVVLSPDGALNFVSFATLVSDKQKFLAEEYTLSYVASARDLLRTGRADKARQALLLGDPSFSSNSASSSFEALPGTSQECQQLSTMMKKSGLTVELKLGAEATEKSLRGIDSPRLLHLATHGFFLSSRSVRRKKQRTLGQQVGSTPVNPMQRSGLALAGASEALRGWKQGAPRRAEDGLLTAQEVAGLNLQGTWLVTLSACETGIGESRSGEGVFGLRRGFAQAGARNLLLTLWPIADEETAAFMQEFYQLALAGQPAQSLAQVQRDWLVRLRQERGWAEAVKLAGPFLVTSQGPPSP